MSSARPEVDEARDARSAAPLPVLGVISSALEAVAHAAARGGLATEVTTKHTAVATLAGYEDRRARLRRGAECVGSAGGCCDHHRRHSLRRVIDVRVI
eukprot:scaffold167444_cov31-Tisochrysis_lutea.AAC.3